MPCEQASESDEVSDDRECVEHDYLHHAIRNEMKSPATIDHAINLLIVCLQFDPILIPLCESDPVCEFAVFDVMYEDKSIVIA